MPSEAFDIGQRLDVGLIQDAQDPIVCCIDATQVHSGTTDGSVTRADHCQGGDTARTTPSSAQDQARPRSLVNGAVWGYRFRRRIAASNSPSVIPCRCRE